ncbi:MAG: M48 family metalloprotease [Phycisphaerae bacterium]
MIAPLQVILLLLIVAAFGGAPQRPAIALSPVMVVLLVVLAHGTLLLKARRHFARMGQQLQAGALSSADISMEIQRIVRRLLALNTALLAVDLWIFGLGWLVKFQWNAGRIPVLSPLIWLIAPVLTWLAIWWLEYPLELTLHDQAELLSDLSSHPIHPPPSRMQYVHMQFRHGLSLLIVLLAFDFITVAITALMNHWNLGNWSVVFTVLPTLVLLVILPAVVVRYWRTTRLPDGPLRTRLEELSRRQNVGFVDIRVWNTYYRIPNAAILGLLPWCRYFLLTDLLLERLEPQQVEAVFAHEVGHGHHRHIWWYLLTFVAADLLGTGLSLWAGNFWSLGDNAVMLLNFSIVAVLVVFAFSRVSRLCEHQADWFAVRHIAATLARQASGVTADMADNTGYDPPATSEDRMETPARAGARIFSESLSTLVGLANHPRDRAGWMHPSMQNRMNLLTALAISPKLQQRFNRQILWMHIAILLAAATGIALTFWAVHQ